MEEHKYQLLTEHSIIPGTHYENCLLFGECSYALNDMINLQESTQTPLSKQLKFKGKLQEAEAINKNRRKYPYKTLSENVKRLNEFLINGGLPGELDHPENSIIHFKEISHKFTKLWWEGNVLMGEGYILDTPYGKLLRTVINDGIRVGMSSRGVGNGEVDKDGILVIGENYRLVTFDAVVDPSTHSAYQERVGTRKEHNEYKPSNREMLATTVKNTDHRIYNNNIADLILAMTESIVKSETNKILENL